MVLTLTAIGILILELRVHRDSERKDPNVVRQESDNVGIASTEDPEHEGPNVVRQDPDSSPSSDSAIIAAETGLPVDQIEKAIAFQMSSLRMQVNSKVAFRAKFPLYGWIRPSMALDLIPEATSSLSVKCRPRQCLRKTSSSLEEATFRWKTTNDARR